MSLAFVFPGQGSQQKGMGLDFVTGEERQWFQEVNESLPFDLHELLAEGDDDKLARTKYTQPAMFVVSHLIYRFLSQNGIEADYFAGHSLGEYNALVSAGWADFQDLLPAVVARGEAMDAEAQELDGGLAAVLKLQPEPLEELCSLISEDDSVEGTVQVALYNSPGQSVVSGSEAAIDAVVDRARDAGALKAVALDVSGPWHSRYMAGAVDPLKDALAEVDWQGGVPYVPNVTAEIHSSGPPVQFLLDQLVKPVRWVESVQCLLEAGVDTFVEVGPGKVLNGLIKRIAKKTEHDPDIYRTDNIEQTKQTLEAIK